MAHAAPLKTSELDADPTTLSLSPARPIANGDAPPNERSGRNVGGGALLPENVQTTKEDDDESHHHPTPPIDVPYHEGSFYPSAVEEIEYPHSPCYAEPSPLEQLARKREPSISFNPDVKLDTGAHHKIDVPLSHARDSDNVDVKSSFSTSELQNLCARTSLDDPQPELWQGPERSRETYDHERAQATCQTTTDSHHITDPTDLQRPTSLTSLSTISPVTEEIVTPPQGRPDVLPSAINISPVVARSSSLGDPGTCLDSATQSPWAKSRSSSLRRSHRQESRRATASSGKSPASAFLSKWQRDDVPPQPDDEGQVVLTEYVLGKQIGFGGFSVVKEAFKVKDDGGTERFAVKIVRRHLSGKSERENDQLQAEFDHEVRVWRYLSHRHVLPLDAVYVTDQATFCFTHLTNGGTLFDLVRRHRGGLKLNQAKHYAYQLARAIRYLHQDARVVHRDIKLENCLLDLATSADAEDTSHLVLCDFGMAEWLPTETTTGSSPDPYDDAADRPPPKNIGPSDTSTSRAGSLEYASPELLSSREGVLDPVVDVWAFGVVVFSLLVGSRPFQDSFQPRVRGHILSGEWNRGAILKGEGDLRERQNALEMVRGCLEMDPVKRWTISDVMSSRWFRGRADTTKDEETSRWSC